MCVVSQQVCVAACVPTHAPPCKHCVFPFLLMGKHTTQMKVKHHGINCMATNCRIYLRYSNVLNSELNIEMDDLWLITHT